MAFMGSGKGGALSNPFVKNLTKETSAQTNCATYGGIIAKCSFFIATVLLGAALSFVLDAVSPTALLIGAAICGICFLICPFITIFARKTAPVTGSLTFISLGYLVGLIAVLVPEYRSIILLAAGITVAIVFSLQILFSAGVIRVTAKLRSVVCTCLLTMILSGLLLFVFALIPAFRPVYLVVATNPVICIAISLIYIVIACMCLLSDFYTVQSVVEGGLNKSCEWFVAYSLSYTIVWLFMEVLDLLLTIKRLADD